MHGVCGLVGMLLVRRAAAALPIDDHLHQAPAGLAGCASDGTQHVRWHGLFFFAPPRKLSPWVTPMSLGFLNRGARGRTSGKPISAWQMPSTRLSSDTSTSLWTVRALAWQVPANSGRQIRVLRWNFMARLLTGVRGLVARPEYAFGP